MIYLGTVAVPGGVCCTRPFDYLIFILNDTRFEGNQQVGNFEGGGGQTGDFRIRGIAHQPLFVLVVI